MNGPKKLLLTAAGVAAAALAVVSFLAQRDEVARERLREEAIKVPPSVSRTAAGEPLVRLAREAQARIGLTTEPLAAAAGGPEVVAFGRLEIDPAAIFVVRAPAGGKLRASKHGPWPALGQNLAAGSEAGLIEPRLAPAERLGLMDRRAAAGAEASSSGAALEASRAALVRARALNADDKNLSDRALQEAEARVKADEARLAAAQRTMEFLKTALDGSAPALPLGIEAGGEVVEVLAQPGESVESGQALLRLARFATLIARVEAPAGERVAAGVASARILALGHEDRTLVGRRLALAANVDPNTQGQPFLFEVSNPGLALRPGLAVTAYLPAPGAARARAVVPPEAVVRADGKTWIYCQEAPDQFVRKSVHLEPGAGGGRFVATALAPGSRVVTRGAQLLLSEESKSQIHVGEEGSGN